MITKAASFGLNLDAYLQSGDVVVRYCPFVDRSIDEVVGILEETLDEGRFDSVVVEGMVELAQSMGEPARRSGLMTALGRLLQSRGITAVLPVSVPQSAGPEMDLGQSAVADLAENLVLFRYVLFGGELYRILSILAARNSAFDPSIRQYTISEAGMSILERLDDSRGLLEGIEQLASEARVKRSELEDRTA